MTYNSLFIPSGFLSTFAAIITALLCGGSLLQSPETAAETPIVKVSDDAPPSDAVIIFDGSNTDKLVKSDGNPCDWPVENKELVVPGKQRSNRGLWTTYHFRDAQIHVEFLEPKKDQHHGNSGLYLHGICELQIYASQEKEESPKLTIGALYGITAPLVNAGKAPGKWQTYDVLFTAPRRDKTGKVVKPGRITALLNGVLVQRETEFSEPHSKYAPMTFQVSPYTAMVNQQIFQSEAGPLYLQDHGSQVRFRNIWIRPLDDKAGWFDPSRLAN